MTDLWRMPLSGNGARRHASLPRLWWAALLSLAMLVGLPPDADAQNSPAILQYKTSLTFSPVAAVDMTARCVGYTSQPLTVNSRVQGKPDNPSLHRFNAANDRNFDLSKTAQSLTLSAGSTDTHPIPVQASHAAVLEPEEQFECVMQGNDKGPAKLLSQSNAALTEAENVQGATCQLVHKPIADSMGTTPFVAVSTNKSMAEVSG